MAVEMRITINEAGQIQVMGPLADKILCFGLLKAAELTIAAMSEEELTRIARATIALPYLRG